MKYYEKDKWIEIKWITGPVMYPIPFILQNCKLLRKTFKTDERIYDYW